MLSNFQSGGNALVQIFLLGQPEFRDKLQNAPGLEQLRQRVIATHHLDPMKEEEVGPYIAHRLALVGWNGRPRFTDEACAALFRHSNGVPRRLNTLASRALLFGAVENLDEIDGDVIDSAFADMAADGHGSPAPAPAPAPAPEPAEEAAPGDRPRISFGDRRPGPAPTSIQDQNMIRRIAALEARCEEQEVALRRVLGLLVEWVEGAPQGRRDTRRNSAA